MKPRIVYNKHPLEVSAREIALALEKEYKKKVIFTEFDHGKAFRGFKLPSSDMDDFVDEYLSFLIDESDTPGSHLDSVYLFFRKHPELLLTIDTLKELNADSDKYLRFGAYFSGLWIKECKNGVISEYLEKITDYFKPLVHGRFCLDLHNSLRNPLPKGFLDRSCGEVLFFIRGKNNNLKSLISSLKFQSNYPFLYDVCEFKKSSLNPPTHLVEFFEDTTPPKIPKSKQGFKNFLSTISRNKMFLSELVSVNQQLLPDIRAFGTYEKSKHFDDYLNWMRALLDEILKF